MKKANLFHTKYYLDSEKSIMFLFFKMLHQNPYSSLSNHSTGNSPLPSPASQQGRHSHSSLSGPYSKIVEGAISSLANISLSTSAPTYEKAPGSGRRSSSRDSDVQVLLYTKFAYLCYAHFL